MTAISSDKISHYAGKKVGNLLGLERMTIEGNLFKINRSSGPQLIASKKISSRLKLTYMTSVGEMNEQGMRLDYRLSKHSIHAGANRSKRAIRKDLKYGLKFK